MIRFYYEDTFWRHPTKFKTLKWVNKIVKILGLTLEEVNYIFTSDAGLVILNETHHDSSDFTDILTFDYRTSIEQPLFSDVYISVERVRENAGIYDTTFLHELNRVMAHGLLHLAGYQDDTPESKEVMRFQENRLIAFWQ